MISTNSLLRILGGLFIMDIVLTFIAVGYMGAIELNPLINVFGLTYSMAIKVIVSAAAMYILYKCTPNAQRVGRITLSFLVGLYGAVAMSNVYQLSKVFI